MQSAPAACFGDLGLRSRPFGIAPILPGDNVQSLHTRHVSFPASVVTLVAAPALAETAERSGGDAAGATVAYFWIGLSFAAGIKGIVEKMKKM